MKKLGKKRKTEEPMRRPVPVLETNPETGLSSAQAQERVDAGWANLPIDPPGKTVGQIIKSNVFTYFNMLFFLLAAFVLVFGTWQNAMFLGVVFANIAIGIVQELRSKRTLDKLTLLTAPHGAVIRDGRQRKIPTSEMVRDDIVVFSAGSQIFADAVVVAGECSVNEALITGEADEIKKPAGADLLSGSFVVSGECRARLTQVGADSYANRLTIEAKEAKPPQQSEMMRSLTRLVQIIGIAIIPLGILMAIKEIVWLERSVSDGVVATVASLIGMIPEGLYLLTSMALAAGVVRLAQKKTLVHDMGCIETLARVDVLCVDKTGTVTENKMAVEDVIPLCPDRFEEEDIRLIMADYVAAMRADNDTMAALRKYFTGKVTQQAIKAVPFTSAKKFGGVSFHEDETYLLGAPDVLLGERYGKYARQIDAYSSKGCRVLLLALYDGQPDDEELDAPLMPISLILLSNKIRAEAPETFRYFAKQGVAIKVISGDNAMAVSEVAKRAGIKGAESYVDARTLETDEDIAEAIEKYTVFGRVTPDQKRKFVRALKAGGHTVAMTGDGVNDVLALKEADCSIAMASGSDAASQVSHIVLLESNFAAMPSVVAEGRRVINNIERSAALFLVKNIFSFALALISLIFTLPYPVTSAQMSLVSALTIGAPGFVLAMEPNISRIKGKFLPNVIYRALPGALTDLFLVLGVILFCMVFEVEDNMMSTVCAIILNIVGLMVVHFTCKPYNLLRKVMIGGLTAAFVFCVVMLPQLFTLSSLDLPGAMILVVFALLSAPALIVIRRAQDKLKASIDSLHSPGRHAKKRAVKSREEE
ncbi:MAG TPA: cation-translocating P-type ATPase [Candidatus Scatomorpha intestinigallinarum]|uniref:Cation-translocating P-type ATPase n=1 Tax=Candidatus Scatomorpha intestinigallinarum TaxID=2840923 RepID=A0A9D1IZ01_9FIRM|nr:cation-translocating P-type ATPase [Candidatus Scatomorpha intestinigallinarum]